MYHYLCFTAHLLNITFSLGLTVYGTFYWHCFCNLFHISSWACFYLGLGDYRLTFPFCHIVWRLKMELEDSWWMFFRVLDNWSIFFSRICIYLFFRISEYLWYFQLHYMCQGLNFLLSVLIKLTFWKTSAFRSKTLTFDLYLCFFPTVWKFLSIFIFRYSSLPLLSSCELRYKHFRISVAFFFFLSQSPFIFSVYWLYFDFSSMSTIHNSLLFCTLLPLISAGSSSYVHPGPVLWFITVNAMHWTLFLSFLNELWVPPRENLHLFLPNTYHHYQLRPL